MGFDAIELVMEIEDEFRIVLEQDDVAHVVTVGQLVEVVEKKMSPEGRRRTGAAFYRARQIIADSVLIDKRVIRPHTDLRPLIPPNQVAGVWDDLRDAGFRLPALSLSKLGVAMFLAVWITLTAIGVKGMLALSSWSCLGALAGYAMLFFGWLPSYWLVCAASRPSLVPSVRALPPSYSTAGALARRWSPSSSGESDSERYRDADATLEFGSAVPDDPDLSEKALDQLKAVICEMSGAARAEVHDTYRLSEILPRRTRWAFCDVLKQRGAPVLPLQLNAWVRSFIALPLLLIGLALVAGSLWMMLLLADAGWFGMAAVVAIAGLSLAVFLASLAHGGLAAFGRKRRIAWLVSEFPKEWTTLLSTARWLADHGWPFTAPHVDVRSRSVARRIRELVADQVGVPLDRVQLESKLVDLLD